MLRRPKPIKMCIRDRFGTALSLVIVLAIIMDITAQMNIWSVVSVSGMRAQDVANKLLPGLGVVIAILVAIGGLAFNVGNVGGVALGFNAMFGLNEKIGAVIAGCLGIIIFVNKNAKTIMDKVATVLAAVIPVSYTHLVSLTMGNSSLPAGDRLPGHMHLFP